MSSGQVYGSASATSSTTVVSSSASATAAAATKSQSGSASKVLVHPEYLWYGIIGFLALVTIANAGYLAWAAYRRYRAHHVSTKTSRSPTGRPSLRRIPHAILSASRIFSFRLRILYIDMTLLELVFTILYIGGCLALSFAPAPGVIPRANLQPKIWAANVGRVAALQLSFSIVLALKNNPITWLTGVGHEKLNLMHRVVSRCLLFLTWLHFVGMYYRSPVKLINAPYKVCGLVGGIAETTTTILGIKAIRKRFYEAFYVTHVVLIAVFLAAIQYHVSEQGLGVYIYPAWAIWGFERVVRAGRYVLFNFVLRPKDSKALVEAIGGDGLRITLKRRVPGGWTPGQHVFLAFPTLGIQSHPFTIGGACEKDKDEQEMTFYIRAMRGQTRTLSNCTLPTGSCELPAMFDGPYGHPEDIRPFSTCVFIAGGTGITYTLARMRQLLRDVQANDACAQRIVFAWAVRTDTEYEWIATDLAAILATAPRSVSLAIDIYITGSTNANKRLQSVPVPSLQKSGDGDVYDDVEKGGAAAGAPQSRPSITDEKRVSSRSSTDDSTEKAKDGSDDAEDVSPTPTTTLSGTGGSGALSALGQGVRRRTGRPDVYRILEEEVTASPGAVAVDVSGPDGLVAAVRAALCAPFAGPVAVLKGTPTVLLSVEQFRM